MTQKLKTHNSQLLLFAGRAAAVPGLIADLKVPSIGILDMETLEIRADHIRRGFQAAALEFGLHSVRIPRRNAPRDMIDDSRDRLSSWLSRLSTCRLAGI